MLIVNRETLPRTKAFSLIGYTYLSFLNYERPPPLSSLVYKLSCVFSFAFCD